MSVRKTALVAAQTDVLRVISDRVLWLSTAVVDAANRGAQPQRDQGRRPSGVLGVDGGHHDRAVVPRADRP